MKQRKITAFILVVSLTVNLLLPVPAVARSPFGQFFRNLRRGINFVVNIPNKATRWMGPVLGPIAADVLTQNIIRNPNIGRIFNHARRFDNLANNVEEQKKVLSQVQTSFRDQSTTLHNQAEDIRKLRSQLGTQLTGGQMSLDEYQQKIVALDNIAQAYDAAADKFSQSADRIKPESLTAMVARNVFRQTLNQIKSGVQMEIKSSLNRYISPEVINTLIATQDRGADGLLDAVLAGDISAFISGQGNKNIDADELRLRVRDRVKEILKDNKNNLKNNWREEINKVIRQVAADLEKTRKNLPQVKDVVSPTAIPATAAPIPKGEGGCAPGYTPCPRCGINCVQKNCAEVENGHLSYEGYCICGSSGSISENPKDPNKECNYPQSHAACPGCLYACVHFEEDCPLLGL